MRWWYKRSERWPDDAFRLGLLSIEKEEREVNAAIWKVQVCWSYVRNCSAVTLEKQS